MELFKMERRVAGVGAWVRSDSFPDLYEANYAQSIIDRAPSMPYRMVPVRVPGNRVNKPYRRHAAVSQLELRGAIALLESVRTRIVYAARALAVPHMNNDAYDAWVIIVTALAALTRQLEAL
jgi:hypothetical protein